MSGRIIRFFPVNYLPLSREVKHHMLTIPVRISPTDYIVIVALQEPNLERIKRYDPAEIDTEKLPGEWRKLNLKQIHISYATPEDEVELVRLCKAGEVKTAIALLFKGYKFEPTMGDHDGKYGSALNKD